MKVHFYKFQGTGNDFIMIDQRVERYIHDTDHKIIAKLCDRRFGIGADGLIFLENADGVDFKMVYFNADGHEGSMCGNGGRCIISFAHLLGIFDKETKFSAIDGLHYGLLNDDSTVSLQMKDVLEIKKTDSHSFELNTGSPHYVCFLNEIPTDIKTQGMKIRYNDEYKTDGINVNFTKILETDSLQVATYERGVEDETYSCGTGVTAAAISYCHQFNQKGSNEIKVQTKGGLLKVRLFTENNNVFSDIWLTGPAELVYEGSFSL